MRDVTYCSFCVISFYATLSLSLSLFLSLSRVVSLTPVKSTTGLPEDFWNIEGEGGMEGEGTEDEEFGLGAGEMSKSEGHELMDTMEAGAEAVSMEWKVKGQEEEEGADGVGGDGGEGVESEDKAPPIQLPPGLISTIVECLEELKKCLEKAAHTIVRLFSMMSQNC